jgi:hypothetical protein
MPLWLGLWGSSKAREMKLLLPRLRFQRPWGFSIPSPLLDAWVKHPHAFHLELLHSFCSSFKHSLLDFDHHSITLFACDLCHWSNEFFFLTINLSQNGINHITTWAKNILQPMRWGSMHLGAHVLFFRARVGVLDFFVPILFPNMFPIAPHFIPYPLPYVLLL